jgi:quercetin dioxygenase-like cupin family protein
MSRRQVVVVEPGQGDRVGNVELLARTVDTPFFNLGVVTLGPGQGVPGHVHDGEDDSWLVLEGTLTVTVGDDRRVLRAGPGSFVLVPDGTYHALDNEGPDDVRFLNVHAPGGFDRRIGWRPSRAVPAFALLLATSLVALGLGGPASAAGLTKVKVQQIATQMATKVVQQQGPRLRVAQAQSATAAARADRADTAGAADVAASAQDSEKLLGLGPETYLDRASATSGPPTGTDVGIDHLHVAHPATIVVPPGVGFVRVTGVATFSGGNNDVTLHLATGDRCAGTFDPAMSTSGATTTSKQTLVVDRVLPVADGRRTFSLCGWAWGPASTDVSHVASASLVVETVAGGAS